MEIDKDIRVPDVYNQQQFLGGIVERAYREGMGHLNVRVVEPADRLDWSFEVRGDDGVVRSFIVTAEDQLDYANLQEKAIRKLRTLLAA
jgi:hypothetical protein